MTPSIQDKGASANHTNGSVQNLPQVQSDSMGVTRKVGSVSQGELDSSLLSIKLTDSPKVLPSMKGLIWGTAFSDHMLSIKWNAQEGWKTPEIRPYGEISLMPAAMVFHYSPALFEGMKAYKDSNGDIRLYRPMMNMKRMNRSAERLALPNFDSEELLSLIKELLKVDSRWIPEGKGSSLYIRPTLIGTQPTLGQGSIAEAMLFVITCPVGPYYETGFKPVSLEAEPSRVRAWPGGMGQYKVGGNYAPTIMPQRDAAKKGYQQNLWLLEQDGEHLLTEVGSMNLFVVLKKGQGLELITPPLNGCILPGITRDSILTLCRSHSKDGKTLPSLPSISVEEREISMSELLKASADGDLVEMFGSGTAAIICPIERIGYMGKDMHIDTGGDGLGEVAKAVLTRIEDIQNGRLPNHEWSVKV